MDRTTDQTPHIIEPPRPEKSISPKSRPDTGSKRDLENPSTPEKGVPVDNPSPDIVPDFDHEGEDGHIGATEDQVSETGAPAGDAFKDEPRQG
jgi:hypothetical protein